MDKLREAFGQLFANLALEEVQLFVGNLFQFSTLEIDDDPDLVHDTAQVRLDHVKLLPPGMLELSNDKFCHRFWVRLGYNLVQFDLASIDE